MLLKLVACEVFMREICHCVARTPHTIDMEFTEKAAHDKSEFLREVIQSKIDATEKDSKKYDAILLCYGLCGNSTNNLLSRNTKIIIPRAHDCCTIFLGSKNRFKEHFAENPSLPFSSTGYTERGDFYLREPSINGVLGLDKSYEEYVKLYGEENAKYIIETLDSNFKEGRDDKVVFIEVPETQHLGYADKCRTKAQSEGKEFVQLQGDIRLIRNLLFGEWNSEDFLTIEPLQRTVGVYDWEEIIRAKNIEVLGS